MKHIRWIALVTLLVALCAILAIGFYLGATHQEPHPDQPAAASSAR